MLSERMMLTNPVAARMLEGTNNGILWEQAVDAVSVAPTVSGQLRFESDEPVAASFERVHHGAPVAGVLVRVRPPASPARRVHRGPPQQRADPSSSAGQQLHREIALSAAQHRPVLVLGPVGSGKLHTAEQIHHAADGPDASLRVIDAALAPVRGQRKIVRELASAIANGDRTIVVRHLEYLSGRMVATVAAVIERRGERGPRLIATADAQLLDPNWLGLFPLRIEVPRLRERVGDLPTIIRRLIERHGGQGRVVPAAMQALSRHEWVGNVRELEGVISSALVGHLTADLTLKDLPLAYQDAGGRRRMSRMEQVERDAIVKALAEAGGNRTRAAEIVGIGRATLYRRVRAYGLDLETSLI